MMKDRFRFRFRVWDDAHSKMLLPENGINFMLSDDGEIYRMRHGRDISDEGYSKLDEEPASNLIPMQCTGLRDKNGKLIYEGDILKFIGGGEEISFGNYEDMLSTVYYDAGKCCFTTEFECLDGNFDVEIIGSIHETPELLEGERCKS